MKNEFMTKELEEKINRIHNHVEHMLGYDTDDYKAWQETRRLAMEACKNKRG